jgi:tRNA G18 (ribose-2'-O)-methylase SpoU
MPTPHLSLPRPTAAAADPSALDHLPPAGSSHHDVRRYSRARRNLLPRAEHVTAVAGGWAHEVVLRSGATVDAVLWCPGERPYPALEATAAAVASGAGRAIRISERTLARVHPGLTSPALLSVVRLPRWPSSRLQTAVNGLVLVADGIEYAGNLGTLIRTADACAVDALVLTRGTARVTHPKAFVASRGTVLTTPVLEYGEAADARADLAAAGFTTYVADPAGATSYRDAGLGSGPTAVVVGSESDGVAEEWRTGLTRVSIPMRGRADSLNVAASAAVLLFEARGALDRR